MATKTVLVDLDMGGIAKVTNLPTPVASGDAAPKGWVEGLVNAIAWKDTCRVASTANVTVASPGASIDAVGLAVNDRVLLKDQTTTSENGIYIWNGAAVPMTRALDFDATAEIEGAVVPIEEGTANTATRWYLSTQNPTIGSALAFTNLQGAAAVASTTVAGVVELATQAEVDTAAVSPANLAVTPVTLNTWSGRPLKFQATIGDGVLTQIDVTHNLGTKDVHAILRATSGDAEVIAQVTYLSTTVCRFNFNTAPALNSIRAVLLG